MHDFHRQPETVLHISEKSKSTMAHEMDDVFQTSLYTKELNFSQMRKYPKSILTQKNIIYI